MCIYLHTAINWVFYYLFIETPGAALTWNAWYGWASAHGYEYVVRGVLLARHTHLGGQNIIMVILYQYSDTSICIRVFFRILVSLSLCIFVCIQVLLSTFL
jgi:hypothetical protein